MNLLQNLRKNKTTLCIVVVLGVVAGIFLGYGIHNYRDNKKCVSKLHFIKPNLNCDLHDDKSEKLSKLQNKLEVVVDGIKKTGKAKRVSVFVRDLETSRFAGVNDGEVYYLASLLKVPVMVGGFKLAEVEPRVLDQKIFYSGEENFYNDQVIKPVEVLKAGESYSVIELMRRSVIYSDNTAAQLLFDFFPEGFLDRIMEALGVQLYKPTGEKENFITAKSYANLFRILYNASYLTKEYSDESLSILTQTDYKKGAVSKLPSDVVVAHKFAERTDIDFETRSVLSKQLHECGIVYAKNYEEPYIFCIMTDGYKYDELEKIISDISLMIYEEMVDD